MLPSILLDKLRFYFITDEGATLSIPEQVRAAVAGGATMIQFRHKTFTPRDFDLAMAARSLCRINDIPFIVNDDLLLARAVEADGVHIGQGDASPRDARRILGDQAVLGLSVSTLAELEKSDLDGCDYLGTGPVFATTSKPDAEPVIGLEGLRTVVERSSLPVVAIGGIDAHRAAACLQTGAVGVAVISCISRSRQPVAAAERLARSCGITVFPKTIHAPWQDEFGLIAELLADAPGGHGDDAVFAVAPGDDAAVLKDCRRPVVSTDAQIQGVHFDFNWQSPEEVGYKAAVIALSDLAAAYARPVAMFVNLTLPADVSESLAKALYRGLNRALREYHCALGGGNISAGGQVALNLFVVGDNDDGLYPARANARPGQSLYCSGRLGKARAGLLLLQRKMEQPESLITAFKYPRARFDAAAVLAENGVDCVIDVSDGLAGDAAHIARASGVTLNLELSPGLFDPSLLDVCALLGESPETMIFRGGEEYELLFTCFPEQFEAIRRRLPEVCRIGGVVAFDGRYLKNIPAGLRSFEHRGRRDEDRP